MELKFSGMTVDASLAKEYLNKHKALLELYNDYDATTKKFEPFKYNGKIFIQRGLPHFVSVGPDDPPNTVQIMAASLKKNANLIAQLEYHFRNIPIEVTNVQLNLLIQYMKFNLELKNGYNTFYPEDSLLMFGTQIQRICKTKTIYCVSRETAAICHLFVTLFHDAGSKGWRLIFKPTPDITTNKYYSTIETLSVKGVDSGTVAVVSDDADIDSAVDKLISVPEKAPWRLRRILVQESVYQHFKDAISWKCQLKPSGDKPQKSDVLCSDTLTYNDIMFLLDPVQLVEDNSSVVTVEAYRTTKELISLLQQDRTRYLSLWTNGIAEINEVTHATKSPVVWVNNVADFRGPPQVSEAVFAYSNLVTSEVNIGRDRYTKICKLSQAWLKLDLESRRDILCSVLDKYILLNNTNKQLTEIRECLLTCTPKSFVDVGKDYVCMGMSQPLGLNYYNEETLFSVDTFKSILQGNALAVDWISSVDLPLLEQAGVPVFVEDMNDPVVKGQFFRWNSGLDTVIRAVWTNSGTIFAN